MSTARKIVVFGGVVWAGLLVWGSSKEGRRRRESRDQLSRGFVSPSGATPNGESGLPVQPRPPAPSWLLWDVAVRLGP